MVIAETLTQRAPFLDTYMHTDIQTFALTGSSILVGIAGLAKGVSVFTLHFG